MRTEIQVIAHSDFRSCLARATGWAGQVARLYRAESTSDWFEELAKALPREAVFKLVYFDEQATASGYGDWRIALDSNLWWYAYILDLGSLEFAQVAGEAVLRRLRGDNRIKPAELTATVLADDYLRPLRVVDATLGWGIF